MLICSKLKKTENSGRICDSLPQSGAAPPPPLFPPLDSFSPPTGLCSYGLKTKGGASSLGLRVEGWGLRRCSPHTCLCWYAFLSYALTKFSYPPTRLCSCARALPNPFAAAGKQFFFSQPHLHLPTTRTPPKFVTVKIWRLKGWWPLRVDGSKVASQRISPWDLENYYERGHSAKDLFLISGFGNRQCGRWDLQKFMYATKLLYMSRYRDGTLVAVSAPLVMPIRDSDIPMNVPFTLRNKQPLPQKV